MTSAGWGVPAEPYWVIKRNSTYLGSGIGRNGARAHHRGRANRTTCAIAIVQSETCPAIATKTRNQKIRPTPPAGVRAELPTRASDPIRIRRAASALANGAMSHR